MRNAGRLEHTDQFQAWGATGGQAVEKALTGAQNDWVHL